MRIVGDVVEGLGKLWRWFLPFLVLHGLRIVGLTVILHWLIELTGLDVRSDPWWAAFVSAFWFFVVIDATFLSGLRARDAREDFARKKALALVFAKLGDVQGEELLTDPQQDFANQGNVYLRATERQQVVSDARHLARARKPSAA